MTSSSSGVVAIVGRPNVGKSSLFNRLVGQRKALVHETPGLTRDRLYGQAEWNNRFFTLIDTGGYHFDQNDRFLEEIKSQVHLAIDAADVTIFLVEANIPVTSEERTMAKILHKASKPVILVINKVDQPEQLSSETLFYSGFHTLGFKNYVAISCIHGLNINNLLDKIIELLPEPEEKDVVNEPHNSIKVAVIGKPNAGKSSLVNGILNEERVIVSPVPGTTRDSIDTFFEAEGQKFTLIDTAGIKKAKEKKNVAELLSILSAIRSIERADIALLVIDGENGVTKQDQRIADLAEQKKCACIIILNKWDLVEKDTKTFDQYCKYIKVKLRFLHYAPILPVSAKTKDRLKSIIPEIIKIKNRAQIRIDHAALKEVLQQAQSRYPAGHIKGKVIRVYDLEQIDTAPPVFKLLTNETAQFPKAYLRYLENKIREQYDLDGVPIKLFLERR